MLTLELHREDVFCFGPEEPLPVSLILAEQVTTISKNALGMRIGRVRDAGKLREINIALMMELGIDPMATTTG